MADNDPKVLSRRSANGVRDRQTSVRQADQHLPRVCCRSGAVETNPDASTDIYFRPTVPEGQQRRPAHDGAGRGGWIILLLYSPNKSAFDRTCRPSEIQPISWTK
jgi:hypothetical protein